MSSPPRVKQSASEQTFITVTEAAKLLDLSRTRVVQLANDGSLHEVPCIGIRIVTLESVEKLKKDREAKSR
ncbi:MAG: helix-turn-helix domain-containing protein, partial [Armatimonadetes bacterium]|nr:helix-turn-helix domain-containing protein [Armatimonadota bacterium]